MASLALPAATLGLANSLGYVAYAKTSNPLVLLVPAGLASCEMWLMAPIGGLPLALGYGVLKLGTLAGIISRSSFKP
jgi:hypothetical protein